MPPQTNKPQPSAISTFISSANTKSPREALALEVFHNLRYQHRWTDLKLHSLSAPSSASSATTRSMSPNLSKPPTSRSKSPARDDTMYLISGLPSRNMYVHPDLQKRILREGIEEERLERQKEWVLPLSIGEKWTLRRFAYVFDGLPEREPVRIGPNLIESTVMGVGTGSNGGRVMAEDAATTNSAGAAVNGGDNAEFEWKDTKRVVLGMLAHNGMGGDGTVAYYIMQEGEVKPRQNG